jgi:hypothetical protein
MNEPEDQLYTTPHYGNMKYPEGLTPGDALPAYPPDLGGVTSVEPLDRLRAEIQVAREMYQAVREGSTVDYARLAGALAGALDNIAFYAEWCTTATSRH